MGAPMPIISEPISLVAKRYEMKSEMSNRPRPKMTASSVHTAVAEIVDYQGRPLYKVLADKLCSENRLTPSIKYLRRQYFLSNFSRGVPTSSLVAHNDGQSK